MDNMSVRACLTKLSLFYLFAAIQCEFHEHLEQLRILTQVVYNNQVLVPKFRVTEVRTTSYFLPLWCLLRGASQRFISTSESSKQDPERIATGSDNITRPSHQDGEVCGTTCTAYLESRCYFQEHRIT